MSNPSRDPRPNQKTGFNPETNRNGSIIRHILIVVLLAISCAAVYHGLNSTRNLEPGWQEIQVSPQNANCSSEFLLMYDFSDYSTNDSIEELENVNALYTTLTEDGYAIFTASEHDTQFRNVRYLNDHINETVVVEPVLYNALEQIVRFDSRYPFLAPVYECYDQVFSQSDELDAGRYDPSKSAELMEYAREAASYANDSQMVRLELLGDNQVCLHVADAYLAFAAEHELDTFLDFHWMTNAFLIDYMADALTEHGYTSGYLASYDGFNRNLDTRGISYSHNVYDRLDRGVYLPAVYNYENPTSIVVLRNYAMSDMDRWHYFTYSDGTITTTFLDPADGTSKSSTDNLFAYSRDLGCGEILLRTSPVFIAEELNVSKLQNLTGDGIYSIWGEGTDICYNESDANLTVKAENGGNQYTIILK